MKSIKLDRPHAIMMIGAPGSGKTTFATKFAETFNAPLLDREWLAGRAANDNSAKELLFYQLGELTKTDQFLVIDGCDRTATERNDVVRALIRSGYRVKYVWIQTDRPTCHARLLKKYRASGTKAEVMNYAADALERYRPIVRTTDVIVISGRHTFATQAKTALTKLTASRTRNTDRAASDRTITPTRSISSSRVTIS